MELRWTQEAAADLERIADYLFEPTPDRAERLVRALYDEPANLLMFPNRGRPGRNAGVLEVVADHRGDTFRAVYTVRLTDRVYVLHAFQKKSKHGIATPQTEIDLVKRRLKQAVAISEERE